MTRRRTWEHSTPTRSARHPPRQLPAPTCELVKSFRLHVNTTEYYNNVVAQAGGQTAANEFVEYFTAPA